MIELTEEMNNLLGRWAARSYGEYVIEIRLRMGAVSKGRPRASKHGHMYTPERTRKYEAAVAEEVSKQVDGPVTHPIAVNIIITEKMPKGFNDLQRVLAQYGLLLPTRGDLDNKVKALTDGMNGVAYIDDDQIQKIDATRRYGYEDMIAIKITQRGLSPQQIEQALYSMKAVNGGKTKIDRGRS